jgi:HEAT repeat protein
MVVVRSLLAVLASLAPLALIETSEPTPAAEIPRLIRQLGSADFDEREAASKALETLGPAALDALDLAASNPDAEIRLRAATLRDAIETRCYGGPVLLDGKRVPEWQQALGSKESKERLTALNALAVKLPEAERILPALLRVILNDPSEIIRGEALRRLAAFGPAALAPLDSLKGVLRDPSPPVRLATAQAVWRVAGRADLAVPVLVALLDEADAQLRSQVVSEIGRLGFYAREAVPALTKALRAADPSTRFALAASLWQIDRQNPEAQAFFLDLLAGDSDIRERRDALRSLGRSLPFRPQLRTVLLRALADPQPPLQQAAQLALPGLDELSPPELKTLLGALDSADDYSRVWFARALGDLAPTNPEVIRTLAKMVVTESKGASQSNALVALGRAGSAARGEMSALLTATWEKPMHLAVVHTLARVGCEARSVPELIELLKVQNLRQPAVVALGRIGPDAAAAVPGLIEVLYDFSCNGAATQALLRIGPAAIEPLLQALAHKNAGVAAQSAITLGKIGAKVVAPLTRLVAQGTPTARRHAAFALGQIGPEARAALPELLAGLKEEDPQLRRACVMALCRIDPGHPDVFPILPTLLRDANQDNRLSAIQALRDLGPRARDALPVLTATLKEDPSWLRPHLAEAILRIDPGSPLPLPILLDGIKSATPVVRAAHWRVLGQLGRLAQPALGAIPQAFADKDPLVRQSAFALLLELCPHVGEFPPEVVAAIGVALRTIGFSTSNEDSRFVLARTLSRMGPRAKPLVGVLTEALRSPDLRIRPAMALALWQIDRSPRAVPALVDSLNRSGDVDTRIRAAAALAEIGPEARAAIPALVFVCTLGVFGDLADALAIPLRPAAARALWKIDPTTQAWLLPILLESLCGSLSLASQVLIIETLGEMGTAAREAIPAMRRAARDPEETVRRAAEAALGTIDPRPE